MKSDTPLINIPRAKISLALGIFSFVLIICNISSVMFPGFWNLSVYLSDVMFIYFLGILAPFIGLACHVYGNHFYKKNPTLYNKKSVLIFNWGRYLNLAVILIFIVYILWLLSLWNTDFNR